jgi:phosphatidylinositol 3-kinase
MLSRKFSVNKLYPNTNGVVNNFNGMKKLREYAIKKLSEHTNEELNFILLQLVQAIRYEDISLKNVESPLVLFLTERCSKDIILSSSFFWFIECESDKSDQNSKTSKEEKEITEIYAKIRVKFLENIQKYKEIIQIINNELCFKEELVKISDALSKVSKVDNKKKELRNLIENGEKEQLQETEYYLPIDPRLKIKGTISEECTVFKSAKCPVKYTFKVTEDTKEYNHHEDKDHMRVMFKYGDDLRQDQLILQMINYMDSLLKNMHLDYEFTTYKTLATSKSDGFVEFVPNSRTIFDIKKLYNNQIRAYYEEISNHNEDELNKKLDSYINSCAGYCVVTYILGIGDRHLENLMIDNKGRLFHIDFGYILGKDPKPMPPPIKLCKEMVECMGGKGSKRYEEFQQKCVNAYWVLRDNARVIVNMFYLMIDSGIPELNNIDNLKKLHEKFVPQKNRQEASTFMLDNLRESVDAMMAVFMEKLHALAQYWK